MAFDGRRTEAVAADVPATPLAPLAPIIRRRFRPSTGATEIRRNAAAAVNVRKRLHQAALGAAQTAADGQRPTDRGWPADTPVRTTLKAVRRASLSTPATGLGGAADGGATPPAKVAASPPSPPPPPAFTPPAEVVASPPPPAFTPSAEVAASSPPPPPFTPLADVAASLPPPPSPLPFTPPAEVAAPPFPDSPDSFYQTPMQTPDVYAADAAGHDDRDGAGAVRCGDSAVKAVSLGHNSAQKGTFASRPRA